MQNALMLLGLGCAAETAEHTQFEIAEMSIEIGEIESSDGAQPSRCLDSTPPISWSGHPDSTREFSIIVDNTETGAVHWMTWSIPSDSPRLSADISPVNFPPQQGLNARGSVGFLPICGPGIYRWRIFALDHPLILPPTVPHQTLMAQLREHTVAIGSVTKEMHQ